MNAGVLCYNNYGNYIIRTTKVNFRIADNFKKLNMLITTAFKGTQPDTVLTIWGTCYSFGFV